MSTVNLQGLAKELHAISSAVLSAHVSPDPDAIGSCFGLAKLLQAQGKKVAVCLSDPIPPKLVPFLGGIEQVKPPIGSEFEAAIIIDTATAKRVGGVYDDLVRGRKIFNIDHHRSNDFWGAVNHLDITAPASAVIVWKLAKFMGQPLTPDIANLLYAGLVDDTGGFCFSSATAEAFECGADLVRAGALPSDVANQLYFSVPFRVLKLQALALSNLQVVLDGKAAMLTVTQSMLQSCGAGGEDAEGLVDLVRKVDGTQVAIFLREISGGWKASFRSKHEAIDVNFIAGRFGGGGHRAAAGCTLVGEQAHVERQVLEEVAKALQ